LEISHCGSETRKITMAVKMELLLLRINNSVSQGYITRPMNRKTSKVVINNFICEGNL